MKLLLNQALAVGTPPTMNLDGSTENAVVVQVTNPGTATIFIEGSMDGGTSFIDLAGLRTKDNTTVDDNSAGSGFTPTGGKNTAWLVNSAGCNQIRVRATAVTGAPLVSFRAIVCPPLGIF
jgi:hypothetical protein